MTFPRRWLCAGVFVVVSVLIGACRSQPTAETQTTGGRLFAINCSTCHGPSGQGIGNVPKLVGVAAILNGDYARTVISEGRNLMPSWRTKLTADEINQIVDYIATFGK